MPVHMSYSSYAAAWLLEFRRKVTRFLRLDFKRTVIQYNLRPVVFRDNWVLGNRALFWNQPSVVQFSKLGFARYRLARQDLLQRSGTRLPDPLHTRKGALFRLRTRRMPVVWASKITQRTLTPSRREFNFLYFKKPLRYQHRLTVLIARYYRFRVVEYLTLVEFSLLNTVLRSRLVVLHEVALAFIRKG